MTHRATLSSCFNHSGSRDCILHDCEYPLLDLLALALEHCPGLTHLKYKCDSIMSSLKLSRFPHRSQVKIQMVWQMSNAGITWPLAATWSHISALFISSCYPSCAELESPSSDLQICLTTSPITVTDPYPSFKSPFIP